MTDHELLLAIQELLSGQEWDADTLQDVVDLMLHEGYAIDDVVTDDERSNGPRKRGNS